MSTLQTRALIKKRKPSFHRYDAGKTKRLSFSWRSKKTKQNKIGKKGYPRALATGYKSPVDVRGTTPTGHFPIIVANKNELLAIDTKKQCAIIGRTVGLKRRLELLALAQEKKIAVFNFKNPQQAVEKLTKARAQITAQKKAIASKKAESQKAAKPKQEKKSEAEQKDEAEKKQEGIKQQEKQITKKQ